MDEFRGRIEKLEENEVVLSKWVKVKLSKEEVKEVNRQTHE